MKHVLLSDVIKETKHVVVCPYCKCHTYLMENYKELKKEWCRYCSETFELKQ